MQMQEACASVRRALLKLMDTATIAEDVSLKLLEDALQVPGCPVHFLA
jgi:hypothetical protein